MSELEGGSGSGVGPYQTVMVSTVLFSGINRKACLERRGCSIDLMKISTSSSQSVGTVINDGRHQPFRAVACPLNPFDYDESQMRDDDVVKRQQRSEVEYDC